MRPLGLVRSRHIKPCMRHPLSSMTRPQRNIRGKKRTPQLRQGGKISNRTVDGDRSDTDRTTCSRCAMRDTYRNFRQLVGKETQDVDYRIRVRDRNTAVIVIAPHGGGIEPGTSELAEAIAGSNFSFYAFEGLKSFRNTVLHITSTRFDEPRGLALIARSQMVIALHGEDSEEPILFLGGLDTEMCRRFRASLEESGFRVQIHDDPELQGTSRQNICNRGTSGCGVQLELSNGLRRTFFSSMTRTGRQTRTKQFDKFIVAARKAIGDGGTVAEN